MKSLNFNRKASMLRNMEEEKISKKNKNWDKIVYYVVLAIISFFIFRYFINRVFYVHAEGQVMFNSVKVRVPDDITIHYFKVKEGDTVLYGDTLFAYTSARDEQSRGAFAFKIDDDEDNTSSWQQREVYQLNKNIRLNRLRIGENINLIAWYQSEIQKLENQVILEVSSKNKLESYQSQLEKLTIENRKYNNEIAVFKSMIVELGGQAEDTIEDDLAPSPIPYSGGGAGYMSMKRVYISPMSGVITRIYKRPNEVALKTEEIMNVHQQESVYIKTFFLQEDLSAIQVGDEVILTFPNGQKSHGTIRRFYSATYSLPPEFQKKYESRTRAIAADIFPKDEIELNEWQKFYKISVQIKKSRFSW
ncbi:HlyD family efflux transporter periplasmic adaptor subunit [bacterium SCSIO 12643]|nr:HlyD family efflux transporter periplasmic adaptor subunit [bacterium SCSIO 12643]